MSGKGAKGLSGKGAKGTMGDKDEDKKRPVSRSSRAGLQFPVGRVHRLLKAKSSFHTILLVLPKNQTFSKLQNHLRFPGIVLYT